MPVVTPDDVMTAIRTRWAAVAALQAAIPDTAVYRGRAAERTGFPAAAVKIDEGLRELTSGSPYLQKFAVTIDTYTNADPPATGSVRTLLDSAFCGTPANPSAGVSVPNATATIHCKGLPGGLSSPTRERKDGKDVFRVTARYEVMTQGAR